MTRKLKTSAVDAGQTLAGFLAVRLRESDEAVRARVAAGSVYVGKSRERDPGRKLTLGELVVVHEAAARPGIEYRVVHEDADAVVVDKPSGLPVAATREAAGGLDELVAAAYPGVTLAHRIDRDTSGLVLFARSDAARKRFADALAAGTLERVYLAVVAGEPVARTLDAPIGPDPRDRRKQAARVSGGQPARTFVEVVRGNLVRCTLDTGRTHQIRVHLADAGWPILGDPLYAPPAARAAAPRLALHATRLAWPGGAAESPLPAELAALRRP